MQPPAPEHDYPAVIRDAGPAVMANYDAKLYALRDGDAGPTTLYPEEVELLLWLHGKGPEPEFMRAYTPPMQPDEE